jgi:ADP-heptose:LPS heptosyltransferase
MDVVAPLGAGDAESSVPRLRPREEDSRAVEELLKKAKAGSDAPLVGIFPGAGHPSRCWPLERFSELAWMLARNDGVRIVLFAGPEERAMVKNMRAAFPPSTIVFDRLTIPQLVAATARLAVFVSNDTGPMHIAAAAGTPVVILLAHHPMFTCYIPPGERHRVVHGRTITSITTEEAYTAARAAFVTERMASLFSS